MENDSGQAGGGPRMLLVEDDPDVRDMLRQSLSDAGYVVATAATRAAAARYLLTQRVDLLITDILLKDGNGAVLIWLAQRHGIPALGITGDPASLPPYPRRAAGSPPRVLRKPFPAERLMTEARRVMRTASEP